MGISPGSFLMVLVASLAWGFAAAVSFARLRDLYDAGYHSFNVEMLILMLPLLLLAFTLSLFLLLQTSKRNEVKPLVISSLLMWLIYTFWQTLVAGRF